MVEFVRVVDPETGHHISVPRDRQEQFKLDILNEDAVNANGFPLPPKYKTTVNAEAKAKKEATR